VIFEGELAECTLDFVLRGIPANSQDIIKIKFANQTKS
jgi:hypothetical protein